MAAHTALTGDVSSFSIDSRTLQPGDLFFAIEGDVHDGHEFVADVLARGASAAVVHEDLGTDPSPDPGRGHAGRPATVGDSGQVKVGEARWSA